MFVHEDSRRKLIEWAEGDYKVAKALIVKQGDVAIGDHYHRHKDEKFLLIAGTAKEVVVGEQHWENVPAPFVWDVPRGTYHCFIFEPGSILFGVGTEAFDPADEIKGIPLDAENQIA